MSDTASEIALVPTGLPSASCQCIRSLGRAGIPTVVAADDDSTPEVASRYCNERLSVPSPTADFSAYREALLEIASRPDVATIVPCREEDAYLLSKHRSEFESHVSLVVPSPDVLESVHDRLRLVEAAEAAGVPVPRTRRLSEVSKWDDSLLVKSRYNLLTADSVDGHPADQPAEAKTITHVAPGEPPDCEALREEMGHDPVVQEFVPHGGKYMFAALYDHGEPLSTFQHEQIRGDSYVGGGGVYRKSIFDEDLEDVARRLLGELEWHGLACLEYIRDANTGEFKLLECNPRLWQSLPSTVRAGADFPYQYWLAATGRTDRIDADYDVGVGTHMLYGELGYLASILRDESPNVEPPPLHAAVRDVATSCLAQPHFDYLCLDDPRPFFSGIRTFLTRS